VTGRKVTEMAPPLVLGAPGYNGWR
jgi:hypothetical protein